MGTTFSNFSNERQLLLLMKGDNKAENNIKFHRN